MIEFICASHKEDVLQANLLHSPILQHYPLTVQRGYDNVARAYNEAKPKALFVCYVHQDVYLPESFEWEVIQALGSLSGWGVLGVAGVEAGRTIRGNIMDRGKPWGASAGLPHKVETLDEMLLITRGDLIFDENLPLHFYGADICMQARMQEKPCYAIKAFCHHNSDLPTGYRSDSFRECEKYFRNKWIDHLPISTTCAIVSA